MDEPESSNLKYRGTMSGYFALPIVTDKTVVARLAAAEYQRTRSAISDVQNLSMVNCTITLDQRDLVPNQPLIAGDFNLMNI